MSAPGPYLVQESVSASNNGIGHVYVVDKDGRKLAAVWGPAGEKVDTAALLAASWAMREALLKIKETPHAGWALARATLEEAGLL